MSDAAALRGGLTSTLRARELALLSSTPCERVRALGSVGASGRSASAHFAGEDAATHEKVASPFAAQAGFTHESVLLMNDAAHTRRLYEERLGISIAPSDCEYLIFQDPLQVLQGAGISEEDEALARRRTIEVIDMCLRGERPTPMLIAQARVPVRVGDTEQMVKPDALLWTGEMFRVGEMKSFIDRGGYTDSTSVGSAVRQAAVSVVGLRQLVAARGADPDAVVSCDVDLFFRRRIAGQVSLRSMSATAEVAALGAAIGGVALDQKRYLELTGGLPLDTPDTLRLIPNVFTSACRESCGLHTLCEAEQAERPTERLGSAVAELAAVGISVHRAAELGEGAEPASAVERRAAYALRAAFLAANT